MEEKSKDKLERLISERVKNIGAIRAFDELFYKFKANDLKQAVVEINMILQNGGTQELLRIFHEDPYSNSSRQYYVQVQLFSGPDDSNVYLSNTMSNPAIIFEGISFNAKVKVSTKIQEDSSPKPKEEIAIRELTPEKIQDIIISFIESVYKK